jgi:hypothetical protein
MSLLARERSFYALIVQLGCGKWLGKSLFFPLKNLYFCPADSPKNAQSR